MAIYIPTPISGGLFLTYRCNAACRHCMYLCGPQWRADWLSPVDLELAFAALAGRIAPSPLGAGSHRPQPRSPSHRRGTLLKLRIPLPGGGHGRRGRHPFSLRGNERLLVHG
ncbi:MAG: hypothetical protein GX493_02250 [Firmicutes bacterium]|nr:hypothetical protein [Bacillota bacterium]